MAADAKISFCASVAAAPRPAPLAATLEAIRSGKWGMLVTRVRAAKPGPDRDKAKKGLPGIVFAGEFSARRKEALTRHSGILCLDLDGKDNPNETPASMKAKVAATPQALACFVSPSGEGLKVLVAVAGEDGEPPKDAEAHERCFRAAEQYYHELGLVVDPSGKDVCRLCFVSHDPGLWRRLEGQVVEPFLPAPAPAPLVAQNATTAQPLPRPGRLSQPSIVDRAARYLAKLPPAISGQKGHDALYDAALALVVGFGLDEGDALELLTRDYNPRCQPPWSARELEHKVKSAAANSAGLPIGYLRDRPLDNGGRPHRAARPAPHPALAPASEGQGGESETPAPPENLGRASGKGAAGENPYPDNDTGNARRMVDRHGAVMRWTDSTPPDCLFWRGAKWARGDDAEADVLHLWVELAAEMLAEAEESGVEARQRWALKCGNAHQAQNMKNILKTMPEVRAPEAAFDPPSDLLPCANGVLNLRTGELREEHRPEDMNTHLVPVPYDPDAKSETWTVFLADLISGDPALHDYLQGIAGLCLTPYVSDQAVFVLIGEGKNGKSTFLDAIAAVLGDYVGHVRTEVFLKNDNDNGNKVDLAIDDQQGKRLTIGTEIPRDLRLNESLVKTFTEQLVTGRALYHKNKTYYNTTKLLLYGNYRPYVRDGDTGIWRRLKLIELDAVLDPARIDLQLGAKLRRPAEQKAILAWMVQGARRWYDAGMRLEEPERVTRATHDWRTSLDKMGAFVDECCYLSPDAQDLGGQQLYNAYRCWCKDFGYQQQSFASFRDELVAWKAGGKKPPVKYRKAGGRAYFDGIVLNAETSERVAKL